MFGKRSKRAERRQRALEELLWLDPVDRERRIIAGVAGGEFSADEAESALRLVSRLDSLRSMSLPEGGRLLGGKAIHSSTESGEETPVPFAAAPPTPRRAEVPGSGALPGAGDRSPVAATAASDAGGDPVAREDGVPNEPVAIPIVPNEPVAIPIAPDLISIPAIPEDGHDERDGASGRIVVPFDALDAVERWLAQRPTAARPGDAARPATSRPARARTGATRGRKGLGPRVDWPVDGLGDAGVPAASGDAASSGWIHQA